MTNTVSFGYEEVAPEEKTRRVGDVFASVASRYDLMNDAMSAGMHRLWKDRFVRRVKPRPGEEILDMAGGTGDIAFRMAAKGASITVADINPAMLEVGMERAQQRGMDGLVWTEANAEVLQFPDRFFDAYTIAFGIRNVPRIELALSEAHRVLKRGGRFLCLEFSQVDTPVLAEVYKAFSDRVIPPIGRAVTGDAQPYRYLVESIRKFPTAEHFSQMIAAAGFRRVTCTAFSGNIAALHAAWKL
jgi:demethylmenaquinone methyltransferase/2-methoxy-6-polyprenyl-1,4-benzoquinol methylase